MSMPREPMVWAVSDGRAGNARQAEALAHAIGGQVNPLRIEPRAPWRWVSPHHLPGSDHHLRTLFGSKLDEARPDLIVGCGRQASWMLRGLKRQWPTTFTVQILDPRACRNDFDVIVCPEHDGLSGPNVLVSVTAMHEIDDPWLADARCRFPELLALPRPICAVLVGGESPMLPLDEASLKHLFARIDHLPHQAFGTVLLTTSRRTPSSATTIIRRLLEGRRHVFWQPGNAGENPYPGFLAVADRLVVTPDSVNMLSEAVAVGVPVYTLIERPPTGKLAAFHQAMTARGLVHQLGQAAWPRPPLRETANIASRIRERWQASA